MAEVDQIIGSLQASLAAEYKAKILITRKWPASVEAELMKHYDVQCNDSDVAMTVDDRAALGEYDAILPTVTDIWARPFLTPIPYAQRRFATMALGFRTLIFLLRRRRVLR